MAGRRHLLRKPEYRVLHREWTIILLFAGKPDERELHAVSEQPATLRDDEQSCPVGQVHERIRHLQLRSPWTELPLQRRSGLLWPVRGQRRSSCSILEQRRSTVDGEQRERKANHGCELYDAVLADAASAGLHRYHQSELSNMRLHEVRTLLLLLKLLPPIGYAV